MKTLTNEYVQALVMARFYARKARKFLRSEDQSICFEKLNKFHSCVLKLAGLIGPFKTRQFEEDIKCLLFGEITPSLWALKDSLSDAEMENA